MSGGFTGGPPGNGGGGFGGNGSGPGGGFGGSGSPVGGVEASDPALISYLLANQGGATWIVATSSAQSASDIELATGKPVTAMGGFIGTDPAPTLSQLESLVASGQLRYVLLDGGGAGRGFTSDITAWVTSSGVVVDYGGRTGALYDVSGAATR